ncbi:MAG: hypothetical protein DRP54_05880 [Spirochaetes bacterium]|nr:MAG: hypothetical protein DRP54_05880 [Spirochaetota bacterium]
MGIFGKKKKEDENLPTNIFMNPKIKVLEGFARDGEIPEPIIRMTKHMREKYGVNVGEYVTLKKDGILVKARVDVSSKKDGEAEVCRLNKAARTALMAKIGDEIEIIPPESIVLLIDTSGSMGDFVSGIVKIDAAKDALREFIRSKFLMAQGDRIGIVTFGEFATVVEGLSTNYEHLENRSQTLVPNGATAMYEGMKLSIDMLSGLSGVKRIVMLSDGVPTTTGRMAVIQAAKDAASKNVVIDTVGVGSPFDLMGYDEWLLKRIAEITGGTFRRVIELKELAGSFVEIAQKKNFTYLLPEK